jgi:hypothetical protein
LGNDFNFSSFFFSSFCVLDISDLVSEQSKTPVKSWWEIVALSAECPLEWAQSRGHWTAGLLPEVLVGILSPLITIVWAFCLETLNQIK